VYDPGGLPTSVQWNGGIQMLLPWAISVDASYVGQHSFNEVQTVNLNAIDMGAAFLPANQDPTLPASTTPGATAKTTDLLRAMPGYSTITQMWQEGWATFHSMQLAFDRRFRNGVSFGFNDTITLSQKGNSAPRLQHNPDGSFLLRSDQAEADALLSTPKPPTHIMKANFVWDLPDMGNGSVLRRAVAMIVNDWQLSGIWTGATGSPYAINFSYQSGGTSTNLTGSPDYGARIRIVGDTGSGCSSDIYRQFNTAAFNGPPVGSVGLESGNAYMKSCFSSVFDLSIARNIKLGGNRQVQLRADMFNAPNSAIITGRNASVTLASPSDPVTALNLPYDAAGNLIPARSLPRGAGFGVANNYQAPRSVQVQIRFSF
jgi:hypothetical protein